MKCRLCGKDTDKVWPRLCSMCDDGVVGLVGAVFVIAWLVALICAMAGC
jgi:hypothetical protein